MSVATLTLATLGGRLKFCLFYNVISTEVRVKPERSGEIPRGCQSITLLFTIFSTIFVGVADGRADRPRTADRDPLRASI